jgi:hypothetical protein
MTYILIALPIVLFLVWLAQGWFVAKRSITEKSLQLPRDLP